MSTIEESGFLSEQIQSWIIKHRTENKEWFELSDGLNIFSQKLMLALAPSKDDEPKLLTTLLFSRVLSHFQGTLLLTERGMIAEARSLLRGMLDATFALVALCKHPDLIKDFVNDDVYQRLKLVNCCKSLPKKTKRTIRATNRQLNNLENELKNEIEKKKIKPLTSEFLAQKAGMLGFYNTLFVMLSASTHSRARDMERHLVIGTNDALEELKWGPDVKHLDEIISAACECQFNATRSVAECFGRKLGNEFDNVWDKYNRLVKSVP